LMLPSPALGAGLELSRELVLGFVVLSTLLLLRLVPSRSTAVLAMLNNKHSWIMSVLCVMSLGSFLGFAAAFPLTLHVVFGYEHGTAVIQTLINTNAPGVFTYAWMG